jgi:hypothetical protein
VSIARWPLRHSRTIHAASTLRFAPARAPRRRVERSSPALDAAQWHRASILGPVFSGLSHSSPTPGPRRRRSPGAASPNLTPVYVGGLRVSQVPWPHTRSASLLVLAMRARSPADVFIALSPGPSFPVEGTTWAPDQELLPIESRTSSLRHQRSFCPKAMISGVEAELLPGRTTTSSDGHIQCFRRGGVLHNTEEEQLRREGARRSTGSIGSHDRKQWLTRLEAVIHSTGSNG